jgi:hypothetical protein
MAKEVVGGRAILAALIAGEHDPDRLAALMRGRVKAHGPKKAMVAVAAHFERREKAKIAKRLIQRLRDLGMAVEVRPAA